MREWEKRHNKCTDYWSKAGMHQIKKVYGDKLDARKMSDHFHGDFTRDSWIPGPDAAPVLITGISMTNRSSTSSFWTHTFLAYVFVRHQSHTWNSFQKTSSF